MVYKLLEIYKKDLSLRNIIFKYLHWKLLIPHFILLFIVFVFSITLAVVENNPLYLLTLLLAATLMPNMLKRTETERKRIFKEIHGGINYTEIRMGRLKRFLKEESIDHPTDKIFMLISMIDNQAKEQRIPFLVGRGVLAALLVPIWIQGISWVLNKQIDSIEVAALFIVILLLVIILVWIFLSSWKHIVHDEIFNGDFNKLRMMSNDLRELLLKL